MRNRRVLFALVAPVLVASCSGVVVVGEPDRPPPPQKVTVCHKGKSLEVSASALDAHLKHGDTRGPC